VAIVPAQPVHSDMPPLTLLSNAIRYVTGYETRYYVDLRSSFEQYVKKFKAKQRHNLQRTRRRFAKFSGGMIEWKEYSSARSMIEFRMLAQELSRKTYQEQLRVGLPDNEQSWRAIMDEAGRQRAHGYLLFCKGAPVAFILARARTQTLVFWKTGYDPAFSKWSPGTVLLCVMLERLFQSQVFRFLEFGPMEYEYKRWFATGSVRCAHILFFRRHLASAALAGSHFITTKLLEVGGRWRDRLGHIRRVTQLRLLRTAADQHSPSEGRTGGETWHH
jgi:CelD/BcsL family acetyltransferase involved in cellulose biosynthesis